MDENIELFMFFEVCQPTSGNRGDTNYPRSSLLHCHAFRSEADLTGQ